jgi:hypothetical protein
MTWLIGQLPSIGLSVVGMLGFYLVGEKRRSGWLVGIVSQFLWLAYAVAFRQWGFVLGCFIFGGTYLRNWLRWKPGASKGKGRETLDQYFRLRRLYLSGRLGYDLDGLIRNATPVDVPSIVCGTSKAPGGWWCSRSPLHDGPCAAWPIRRRLDRLSWRLGRRF